jgi:regulator of sigma E protease
MEITIKIAQLLLSLSILVLLHEMGHFFFARLFKTRVEKFYLFFNPWFSIFKFKKGDTTYGLGWLPLGGYVKIAGMIDESMDKEAMSQPAQPWEFRSKPAWQRLLIMTGGVLVNLLLAFFIYWMVLFTWGETKLPNSSLTSGIWVADTLAYDMGLRTGDKVLSINNKEITYYTDILPRMLHGGTLQVERDGKLVDVELPVDLVGQLSTKRRGMPLAPRIPFIFAGYLEGSINEESGLEVGDQIVKVGHESVEWFDQFETITKNYKDTTMVVTVVRGEETLSLTLALDENGKFQIWPAMLSFGEMMQMGIYEFKQIDYNLLAAFPAGVKKTINQLTFYVQQMGLIFKPETGAYKGLGGFGTIANLFPSAWNWEAFWSMTALLSLILAFMNILPIPALDGGHVLFLLYEMISGRKPGDKFMEYAQITGMILLFGLLIVANGNDVLRWCF